MPESDALDLLRLRTRRLNTRRVISKGRDYVLCWLQQALRAEHNPVLDTAIALGNDRGLPVVVYHGLDNRYPYASHRLHRFILEASQSLGEGVERRGLRFCRYVRRPDTLEEGLVYRLAERAAAIVTDDMPTYVARWQADRVAARGERPVLVVDAACSVPLNAFETHLGATEAFRAAHTPLRPRHLDAVLTQEPDVPRYGGDLPFEPDDLAGWDGERLDRLIASCGVDMTLPPAPTFHGSRDAALDHWAWALAEVVPDYNRTRNNPADPTSSTRLSPWMHFGVLDPRELARAVKSADLHSAARWKFLDELLTWREYYHHRARWLDAPAGLRSVPSWAKATLAEHADDPRNPLPLDALVHGETGDETWNAAQKQFLLDGWMHNNLRMYWVKQILPWCETPEEAWAIACYLNDRLSLDGRDPSTYGGIRWGFGQSKKAYKETTVYGWVPRKTSGALRKRKGVPAWLEEQAGRPVYRIDVPDKLPAEVAARYA
ncbi:MAG: deoxyribodipyrimidine photo-lyase [Rubricoccaceae bacterium]|nr:deoxyribodipyrimidine photo-lyase [Rubricoccaceae bacterium]